MFCNDILLVVTTRLFNLVTSASSNFEILFVIAHSPHLALPVIRRRGALTFAVVTDFLARHPVFVCTPGVTDDHKSQADGMN